MLLSVVRSVTYCVEWMSQTLQQRPAFLDEPAYLPRVTRHDGRAIEEALADPTLFDRGVRLEAAVVEAHTP